MRTTPSGVERSFGAEEIIVSKTDPQGRITYANDVFVRVSGYREHEILGQPHSFIRHPDMPRCVFALLWSTLQSGREVFAYVVNLAKNGDHYWVMAHVTPTFDADGRIVGYHSNRRCPEPGVVAKVAPLYATLLAEERLGASKADAIARSSRLLEQELVRRSTRYEELVLSL